MTINSLKEQARNPKTSPKLLNELVEQDIKLARLVARNPSATTKLLETLSMSRDSDTRKAVASHPGAPPNVLHRLAGLYPREVLGNPIYEFLLLENPNFLDDIKLSRMITFLKSDACDADLIKHAFLIKKECVQLALLANKNAPTDIVNSIAKVGISEVVQRLAKRHINYANYVEVDKIFADNLFWKEVADRFHSSKRFDLDILIHANIPDEQRDNLLFAIAGRIDIYGSRARKFMAISPATDPLLIACLSFDPEKYTRELVFRNSACPDEIKLLQNRNIRTKLQWDKYIDNYSSLIDKKLLGWSESDNHFYHYLVAHYPRTPADILTRMIKEKYLSLALMGQIAQKKTTSGEQLYLMLNIAMSSHDCPKKSQLINKIASHPNITITDLLDLAQKGSKRVRLLIARRHDLPVEVLQALSMDEDIEIKMLVIEKTHTPKEIIIKILRSFVHEFSPVKEQDWRAYRVIKSVAKHECSTKEMLSALAEDESDQNILVDVACHANTPNHIKMRLINDLMNEDVDFAAVETLVERCSDLSMEQKRNLVNNVVSKGRIYLSLYQKKDSVLLSMLAEYGGQELREDVAQHVDTPPDALVMLSTDRSVDVRQAVAEHKNIPIETLKVLSNDESGKVRSAVVSKAITRWPHRETFRKEELPLVILQDMMNEEDKYDDANEYHVKALISQHKNCSIELREAIFDSGGLEDLVLKGGSAAYDAASNPRTSEVALILIAGDESKIIRKYAYRNKKMPTGKQAEELLRKLSKSSKSWIRARVAVHRSAPLEILRVLKKDKDLDVRIMVAANINLPSSQTLELIMEVEKENRNNEKNWLREYWLMMGLINIARNHKSTPSEIRKAYKYATSRGDGDLESSFERALATNPNTPDDIMEAINDEWDGNKEHMLFRNPTDKLDAWDRFVRSRSGTYDSYYTEANYISEY